MSTFRHPVNISICSQPGTIFSTSSGSGGGGSTLVLNNLSIAGAMVYAQTINNNGQFRVLTQGKNIILTQRVNDILFDVNDIAQDFTAPVKRAIPGLQGVSLNANSVLQVLNAILYPTLPPVISLVLNTLQFEFGDNTPLLAGWFVTRTDEPILTINVNNNAQIPTGNTQGSSVSVNKNGLTDVFVPMQVTTALNNVNTSQTAKVFRKLRFGPSNKDGIIAQILDADVNGLIGVFATTYKLPVTLLTIGISQYLIIEIPVGLLNGATPQFKINGFLNNAFSLVRTNSSFTNSFGFAEAVNVYASNSFFTGPIQLEID